MLLKCGVGEDSWESLGLQGDPTSPSYRRSVLGVHWKDWCWSWNSNTLATWWEELTHWKRPWCWEGLGVGGGGDDRGWDGWMASPTWWTWVWVDSRSWWWSGRPGVLRFMGSQRVGHDWATELNWTEERSLKRRCFLRPELQHKMYKNQHEKLPQSLSSLWQKVDGPCTLSQLKKISIHLIIRNINIFFSKVTFRDSSWNTYSPLLSHTTKCSHSVLFNSF